MNTPPLTTELDYETALARLERCFDDPPEIGSAEADEFALLVARVIDYEEEHWSIGQADK